MFGSQGIDSHREVSDDTNLVRNGGSSGFLISRDHNNLDSCFLAFFDRLGDSEPWRIIQRNQANKGKSLHREVTRY
jgi:hypothetical protein